MIGHITRGEHRAGGASLAGVVALLSVRNARASSIDDGSTKKNLNRNQKREAGHAGGEKRAPLLSSNNKSRIVFSIRMGVFSSLLVRPVHVHGRVAPDPYSASAVDSTYRMPLSQTLAVHFNAVRDNFSNAFDVSIARNLGLTGLPQADNGCLAVPDCQCR